MVEDWELYQPTHEEIENATEEERLEMLRRMNQEKPFTAREWNALVMGLRSSKN